MKYTQKPGFLIRMRLLKTRIHTELDHKQKMKQQKYQIFLHEESQHYPSLGKVKRWRGYFLAISCICLTIITIQTCFYYNTIWTRPAPLYMDDQEITLEQIWTSFLNMIPVIFGAISCIFLSFTIAVDRVIYRRWKKEYIIPWI